MIGQTLNNRYRISSPLGKGPLGEVYRATDTQTGQEVAIKVITQKLAFDNEGLARFRREGEALRGLYHPNIVACADMLAVGRQPAIVMEYVPGGSLRSLIQRGPLPVGQAARVALELSDALAQAHHLHIIHGDLKPENVLIGGDGRPKLTDFGVARLRSDPLPLAGPGRPMGTPFYLSPEALEGEPLDAQADIWSLGAVLFEMVAGRVPFEGETWVAVMNKVVTMPPPDLRALRPEIPTALAEVIQRMLTRDKAGCYASMREVASDLERASQASGPAPPTTRPAAAARPPAGPKARPRWGLLLGVGAAALVALAALMAGGVWLRARLAASEAIPTLVPTIQAPSPAARLPSPTALLLPTTTMPPVATATPLVAEPTSASNIYSDSVYRFSVTYPAGWVYKGSPPGGGAAFASSPMALQSAFSNTLPLTGVVVLISRGYLTPDVVPAGVDPTSPEAVLYAELTVHSSLTLTRSPKLNPLVNYPAASVVVTLTDTSNGRGMTGYLTAVIQYNTVMFIWSIFSDDRWPADQPLVDGMLASLRLTPLPMPTATVTQPPTAAPAIAPTALRPTFAALTAAPPALGGSPYSYAPMAFSFNCPAGWIYTETADNEEFVLASSTEAVQILFSNGPLTGTVVLIFRRPLTPDLAPPGVDPASPKAMLYAELTVHHDYGFIESPAVNPLVNYPAASAVVPLSDSPPGPITIYVTAIIQDDAEMLVWAMFPADRWPADRAPVDGLLASLRLTPMPTPTPTPTFMPAPTAMPPTAQPEPTALPTP